MKKLFTLIIILSSASLYAQHCPFDFSAIIVLNVHAENDSMVIPNLEITMYDSNNRIITTSHWQDNQWKEKTYYFWQNPAKTTFTGYIDNENPAVPEKIRFPFAKNNYVLVVSREFKANKYTIHIKDPSKKYKDRKIKPKKDCVYSLCGTYDREIYKSRSESGLVYQPINIILKN